MQFKFLKLWHGHKPGTVADIADCFERELTRRGYAVRWYGEPAVPDEAEAPVIERKQTKLVKKTKKKGAVDG